MNELSSWKKPGPKFTPSERAKAQTLAIALLAEDLLSPAEIAEQVGVSTKEIRRWKARKNFARRLLDARQRLESEASRYAIARKRHRMAALQDRWDRAKRIIEARAADPFLVRVPGGDTGLIASKPGAFGIEYFVDVPFLKELREIEKQAAIEAEQWTEKKAQTLDISISVESEIERLSRLTGIPAADIRAEAEAILHEGRLQLLPSPG